MFKFEAKVSVSDVKEEAKRRIETLYPLSKQLNLQAEDGEALRKMRSYIDLIRNKSNALEKLSPIPFDYINDKHWK